MPEQEPRDSTRDIGSDQRSVSEAGFHWRENRTIWERGNSDTITTPSYRTWLHRCQQGIDHIERHSIQFDQPQIAVELAPAFQIGSQRPHIVEIKVTRADLRGDLKWPEYLDYCDRFFWAVPAGFDLAPFEEDRFRPGCCGLIVADRYDAAILREAERRPLAAPRRKVETLRFARRAARRILADTDPDAIVLD